MITLQVLLSISLILVLIMIHNAYYDYMLRENSEPDIRILYAVSIAMVPAFIGLYYVFKIQNALMINYLIFNLIVIYISTIAFLFKHTDVQKRQTYEYNDILFIIVWTALAFTMQPKITLNTKFIALCLASMASSLSIVLPYVRQKKVVDHPCYAFSLGMWVIISFLIKK